NDILRPFELTAAMCDMQWLEPNIIYAARRQDKHHLQQIISGYREWLQQPLQTGGLS
ncbi:glutathione-regulated potassium-efflux system ancillary protein KefG, partial [Escherichia coli]